MDKGAYDLATLIQSFEYPINENILKLVSRSLLRGLAHLKENELIHRDLKPSNVMVNQDLSDVFICDLGSAAKCKKGDEEFIQEGFTQWYKCPEMFFGQFRYKCEVDIWSLGCVLMELAMGEPVFAGRTDF